MPAGPGGSPSPRIPGSRLGVDFIHTDVQVSMGEAKNVWADRVRSRAFLPQLTPSRVIPKVTDGA
jgi:hypothetical protein